MITWQDFEELRKENEGDAIQRVVNEWIAGKTYKTAVIADTYDRQENDTIMNYIKTIFSLTGSKVEDFTASNNKVVSNFFQRLNVQRNTYSLGNGITFEKKDIKDKFGKRFDTTTQSAGYYSLIHGVSFLYWTGELRYFFKATEFAPLYDEETNVLRGGVRFWRRTGLNDVIDFYVVYEKDGYRKWKRADGEMAPTDKEIIPYKAVLKYTDFGDREVYNAGNYSDLPIIPLYGSRLKQSTLIGLRSQIDSYDLIRSGFANDLTDVSQIYWLIENFGGMTEDDLARFRDRMKLNHIVEADTSDGGKITPYTQEVPFQARQTYLDGIRQSIYDDFGAFDVRGFSNGEKTATEIEAAYQPLDENADDFEAQIIEAIQNLGTLIGIDEDDCTPLFKRNKIVNSSEQIQALAMSDWVDEETKIRHTPYITVDEQEEVLKRLSAETIDRMSAQMNAQNPLGEEETKEE